jgi:hypothetical protein
MLTHLIFFISLTTVSQTTFQLPNWQVREFHAPDVLSHEEVIDIIQTEDESVWFATKAGGGYALVS